MDRHGQQLKRATYSSKPSNHQSAFSAHLLLLRQEPLALQILNNLLHTLLHALQIAANMNLRLLRRLVWRTDARELRDLALPRLLVQALRIARLGHLKRNVDEDLDECERLVRACGDSVQVAGGSAVGFVGRDEGGDGNGRGVGEELGDLEKGMC